jgi:hypothetical protein
MSKKYRPATPVTVTHDGKNYRGEYTTEGGMITVYYNGKRNTTQLGGSAAYPDSLARLLLGEIITGRTMP